MANKIKNKDQRNDAIEYGPKFDSKFSLSIRTKEPLPVVTVILRRGKKKGGTTESMINRWHTKSYDFKMRSNKV